MKLPIIVFASMLSLAPSVLPAREIGNAAVPQMASQFRGGDGKSTGTSIDSTLTIEAGDADSKASVSLVNFVKINAARSVRYKFEASAPFDSSKAKSVDVGTLSGLTAGSSLGTEVSWVRWPVNESYSGLCNEVVAAVVTGFDRDILNAVGGWQCRAGQINEESLSKAVKTLNDMRGLCAKPAGAEGRPHEVVCNKLAEYPDGAMKPAPSAEYYGTKDKELKQVTQENLTAVDMFTLSGKINQQTFNFVLPAAPIVAEDEKRSGWSASLSYARMSDALLWSVGYSFEQTYSGSDEVEICSPIGTTGSTSCSKASLGAPEREDTGLAFAEARWVFRSAGFAVSPRVEFDTEESEWAARVPFYLVRNKEGALTAGIALGWTSKEDDFGISVFVGKPFAYFD